MSNQPIFAGRSQARETFRAQRLAAKSPVRHVDLSLLVTTMLLTTFGAVAIYWASRVRLEAEGVDPQYLLKRHLIYAAVAFGVFVASIFIDYRQYRTLAPLLLGVGVLMLLVVLTPIGHSAKGAQRWIDIGAFRIQPSEPMKVLLLIALASLLSGEDKQRSAPATVGLAMAVTAAPAGLIFLQPDLGTVMVLFAIVFAILVLAGVPIRWLGLVLAVGAAAMIFAVQLDLLKEYQVARLYAFLDSSSDPSSSGFNLAQSKIAIGSGGFAGKPLSEATQTNLAYVPSQHTDFIFTVIGETKGFVGAMVVIGLFGLLLWRSLRIAMLSKDLFGSLVAGGIAAMFAFQVFVNIGMTVGIMPITGIPLPFVSFGGSSLITNYLAMGLLMNIHMRRFL